MGPKSAAMISALCLGCAGARSTPTQDPPPPSVGVVSPEPGPAPDPQVAPPSADATAAPPRPRIPPDINVVLLTVDSLRADMPWTGYAKPIAPNLTALAGRSQVFTHAYSVSSVTPKSVGAILSGRYPSELERTFEFFTQYSAENLFFPETLRDHGVLSTAVHAHFSLRPGRGFEQGFESWTVLPGLLMGEPANTQVTGHLHTPLAVAALEAVSRRGKPFFAWFHYMDPHPVYQPHKEAPDFGATDRGRYDGEVWYADRAIGKLLDFIGAAPFGARTAIIVSADHGEALGEHRMGGHGVELWESLVRVPLMVFVPGLEPRRIEAARSLIDLAPTILELFGVATTEGLRGKSLVPDLLGEEPPARPIVCELTEDERTSPRRSITVGGRKLILRGAAEEATLYDLAADPAEASDLSKTRPDEVTTLKRLLQGETARWSQRRATR